jgi:hypothetical protein
MAAPASRPDPSVAELKGLPPAAAPDPGEDVAGQDIGWRREQVLLDHDWTWI